MLLAHVLPLRYHRCISNTVVSASFDDISPLGKYVMSPDSHYNEEERERERNKHVIWLDIFTHFNLNGYGYRL